MEQTPANQTSSEVPTAQRKETGDVIGTDDGLSPIFSDADISYEPDHPHYRLERAPGTIAYPFIERRHTQRRRSDQAEEGRAEGDGVPQEIPELVFYIPHSMRQKTAEPPIQGDKPAHNEVFVEPDISG